MPSLISFLRKKRKLYSHLILSALLIEKIVVDLCHENKRNVFSPMHNDSFVTIINIVNLEIVYLGKQLRWLQNTEGGLSRI